MPQASSWVRVLVTVVAVAVAAAGGWYLWRIYEQSPWTPDGPVGANVVTVAPDVAGAVVDIPVKDNADVKIGDILFTVDPARYRLALLEAEAVLGGAKSVLGPRQDEQARR